MEAIQIEQTQISPKVILNHLTNTFVFEGESRPENSRKFYAPLIEWIERFNVFALQQPNLAKTPLEFKFYFDYINSSSLKCIYEFLLEINRLHESGQAVKIIWLYDDDDIDMEDNGKEFAAMLDLDFEVKMVNSLL